MYLDSQIDPARIILAFGVCLFLALVCLLKWQRRKQIVRMRVKRGLQVYVAGQKQAA